MSLEELQNEVVGLSLNEQIRLSADLHRIIEERCTQLKTDKIFAKRDRYVSAMNAIIGKDVLQRGRDSERVWGRSFVIWELLKDGISEKKVGALMGLDHSTVAYTKNKVIYAFDNPNFYFTELQMYDKFKKAII